MEYSIGTLHILADTQSDVGMKREKNEDYYGEFQVAGGYLFLVCDGVGGHNAGDKASRIAVEQIHAFFQANASFFPKELIRQSFFHANEQILLAAQENPALQGMATTCVCVFIKDGAAYIGSVGDSRVYFLRDGLFSQLTKDQSVVQQMLDHGIITAEEAVNHPRKNEVLNILGLSEVKEPFMLEDPILLQEGDHLFSCTDGLTDLVENEKIETVVKSFQSPTAKLSQLVAMANGAGGIDNITIQLISAVPAKKDRPITVERAADAQASQSPAQSKLILYAGIGLVVLLALIWILRSFNSNSSSGQTTDLVVDSTAMEDSLATMADPQTKPLKSDKIDFQPVPHTAIYSAANCEDEFLIGYLMSDTLPSVRVDSGQRVVEYSFEMVIAHQNENTWISDESTSDESLYVGPGEMLGYLPEFDNTKKIKLPSIIIMEDIKNSSFQLIERQTIGNKKFYLVKVEGHIDRKPGSRTPLPRLTPKKNQSEESSSELPMQI